MILNVPAPVRGRWPPEQYHRRLLRRQLLPYGPHHPHLRPHHPHLRPHHHHLRLYHLRLYLNKKRNRVNSKGQCHEKSMEVITYVALYVNNGTPNDFNFSVFCDPTSKSFDLRNFQMAPSQNKFCILILLISRNFIQHARNFGCVSERASKGVWVTPH